MKNHKLLRFLGAADQSLIAEKRHPLQLSGTLCFQKWHCPGRKILETLLYKSERGGEREAGFICAYEHSVDVRRPAKAGAKLRNKAHVAGVKKCSRERIKPKPGVVWIVKYCLKPLSSI